MAFFVKQFFLPYVKDELINKSFVEIKELINNQLSDLITDVIIKGKGNLADFKKKVTNIFNKIDEIGKLTKEGETKILEEVRDNIKNKNKDSEKNNYIVIDYFLLQLLPQLKGLIPDTNPKLNLEGTIINIINILLNHISNYPNNETYDNCIKPFSKFIISKSDIPNIAKCSILIKTIKNNTKTLDLPKKIKDRITDFISDIKKIVISEDDAKISEDDAKFNKFIQKNKILLMALDINNNEMYNVIKEIVNNINNKNIDSITLPDNIKNYGELIKLVLKKINEPTVNEKTLQPELLTLIKNLIGQITEPYFSEIKKTIDSKIKNKYYLDNEDIYYEKYIKYKSKYLELKYQNENK